MPLAAVFWIMLFHKLLRVPLILQLNTFTVGETSRLALSEYLMTFICVEQRTPGRPRSSSTLLESYAILLEGNTTEYHLFEVYVIALARLIGNCFTDVSMVDVVVVGVVVVGVVVAVLPDTVGVFEI